MWRVVQSIAPYRVTIAFFAFFIALWFLIVPDEETGSLHAWVASGIAGKYSAIWLALLQGIVTAGMCRLVSFLDRSGGANKRITVMAIGSFLAYTATIGIGGFFTVMDWPTIALILSAGLAVALSLPYLASAAPAPGVRA